jgi:hypothetical protein
MGLFDSLTDRAVAYGQGVVRRIFAPAVDARAQALSSAEAFYQGRQYEGRGLQPSWDKVPVGQRPAPLRLQKPSVQYDVPKTIVDRPTALLFGEGRFPELHLDPDAPDTDVKAVNAWLARVADEGKLAHQALVWGKLANSVGSGCLTWAVVAGEGDEAGEFEFTPHKTQYCTPTFDPKRPGRLVALEKKYSYVKTVRRDTAAGVVAVQETWWHRETWDRAAHVVYADQPAPKDGGEPATWTDVADTATHDFGFVPGVWVKPLDDGEAANVDGPPLTCGIEDLTEDIDRTLSQKSRALRYNLDPERWYTGLSPEQAATLKVGGGATTALPKDGAAGLLEMSNGPQEAAEAHVTAHKARAFETTRVVSPDPEKLLAAARSGRALEILHGPMIELVGELRQTFGSALRDLLNQIVRAARAGKLGALGKLASPPPAAIPPGRVKLAWGPYWNPSPEDLQTAANIAATLVREEICDRETAVRWVAAQFGWKDVDGILERLATEAKERAARAPAVPPPNNAGATDAAAGDDTTEDPADGRAPDAAAAQET